MRCLSLAWRSTLPLTSSSLQAVPSSSSHILPLRGESRSEVGLHTSRWGEASLPRLEGKDPSVSLPPNLLLAVRSVYWATGGANGRRTPGARADLLSL